MYSYIFWPWVFFVLEFSVIDPRCPSSVLWGPTLPWLFTSRLLILMLFSIFSLDCSGGYFSGPVKLPYDPGALSTSFVSVCKNHGKNPGGRSWLLFSFKLLVSLSSNLVGRKKAVRQCSLAWPCLPGWASKKSSLFGTADPTAVTKFVTTQRCSRKFLRWITFLSSDSLIVESVAVVDSLKRAPDRRDLNKIKSEALFTLKFACISFHLCTITFQNILPLLQSIVIQCQALLAWPPRQILSSSLEKILSRVM